MSSLNEIEPQSRPWDILDSLLFSIHRLVYSQHQTCRRNEKKLKSQYSKTLKNTKLKIKWTETQKFTFFFGTFKMRDNPYFHLIPFAWVASLFPSEGTHTFYYQVLIKFWNFKNWLRSSIQQMTLNLKKSVVITPLLLPFFF